MKKLMMNLFVLLLLTAAVQKVWACGDMACHAAAAVCND